MEEPILATKKVLIVDDDEANRYLMQVILEELGCGFDFALNGQDAIEKVRGGGVDLVFMDLKMPLLNGYDATKMIREFNKGIPIIALTAHAMEWIPSKCFAIGMNDFISKPYNKNKIKEEVVRWTRK